MKSLKNVSKGSPNGIALVSVLMVGVIFLALAGAFFASHKTDLVLMGASIKLEHTKNAALSAAEFFQYKLENNRHFGATALPNEIVYFPEGAGDADAIMKVTYSSDGTLPSSNLIKGEILQTGLTFEGRILNNLEQTSEGVHPLGNTPPRTVRVWITTKQGVITKNMDFILKRSPFSSVSMLSGGSIEVDLDNGADGLWWLGARQPSGNAVRANGEVIGPEVLSETGQGLLFEPPQGLETKVQPPYGVIQGSNLNMRMNGTKTDIQLDDSRLEDVENNIKGVLSPGGSGVEVPVLKPEELTSPTKRFTLPAKQVTFNTHQTESGVIHQLLQDGEVVATYSNNDPGSRFYRWGEGTDVAAEFDLETRTMKVMENFELATGYQGESFTLSGRTDSGQDEGSQPTLVLGSEIGQSSISADGITIKGSVGGKGSLKAGDGDLKIRAKSNLSTIPDFGVALHSSKDVVLSKPGSSTSDGIASDWDAFSMAKVADTNSNLDDWMDPSVRQGVTNKLSKFVLSEPGTQWGEDPVLGRLAGEFSDVDEEAKEAYERWTQEYVEAVEGPDPEWVEPEEPEPPLIPQVDVDGFPVLDPDGEPVMIPDPDWVWDPGTAPDVELEPAIPAGPGMTLANYIRMREYLKTLEKGAPDDSWFEPNKHQEDVTALITNQLTSYQLLAGQTSDVKDGAVVLEWNPLTAYLTGSNPFITGYNPDMKFRGLVYAGGNFTFDTEKLGIEIEGALVAGGDINIIGATGARIIYNSELLENLFMANEGDTSAKLERAYWAYY
ncbi:MAG: hypothetical protein WC314_07350 [Vulcanimicrobiota bacterium]